MAAHQENAAKLPLKAQTGWSVQNDHPVRAFLTFLMARPPLLSQEGTIAFPWFVSCWATAPDFMCKTLRVIYSSTNPYLHKEDSL